MKAANKIMQVKIIPHIVGSNVINIFEVTAQSLVANIMMATAFAGLIKIR